jgi:hypothetical protein
MKRSTIITLLLIALTSSTQAQQKKEEDLGYVYILPMGDTPKVFREAKATKDNIHIQRDPPAGERIPFSMNINATSIPKQVKKLIKHSEGEYKISLNRNNVSQPLLINKGEEGFRLVNQANATGKSQVSWNIKLPESSEALAMITPKTYRNKPWANPIIKVVDCSAQKIPAGSVFIFN